MIKLDNPYSKYRPSWKVIIPIAATYPFMYVVTHYSIFAFLYQYCIAILILIIIAQYFDEKLLTKERLSPTHIHLNKIFLYLFTLIVVLIPLRNIAIELSPSLHLLSVYRGELPFLEAFVITIAILAPGEEILFRGFIQYNLVYFLGKYIGILLTSFISAILGLLFHSVYLFILLFSLSIIVGFIYERLQALWYAIVLRGVIYTFMFIYHF